MKGGWILMAGMVALGACTADGGDTDSVGEEDPAREAPVRSPETDAGAGMYVLTSVNGGGLPGVVQQDGECRVEVLEAALTLQAGRFAFQNETREVCGTTQPEEPVMHAAGGSYVIENGAIVLTTDVGSAFGAARGTIAETVLTINELSTDAGTETITWQLERDDAQSVSLPGSREGDDASDMSRTPGVTSGG